VRPSASVVSQRGRVEERVELFEKMLLPPVPVAAQGTRGTR
jgi:hypothetical protein